MYVADSYMSIYTHVSFHQAALILLPSILLARLDGDELFSGVRDEEEFPVILSGGL